MWLWAHKSWLVWLTLGLAPFASYAAEAPLSLPAPAPVVDEYGLLSSSEVSQLGQLVRRIKSGSGVELTIFIPSSLQGLEIEDFSIRVAEQWQLGRKKEDKGLLLIVAPSERKMRFEVGYGLEGDLTDAFTRRVLDNEMRPYFKQGRYYDGILASLEAIQEKVPLGLAKEDAPEQRRTSDVLFLVFVIFFFLLMSFFSTARAVSGRNRYYGGGWGGGGGFGGGSGGGSWGGGGGGFGGGGSSSSW